MTPEIREKAESILNYRFKDEALLARALTHASVSEARLESNERMEFLGDAVLAFIVCESLFFEYPEYLEGELTKIKSAVVSRRVCAEISDKLGLTELLRLGKGMNCHEQLPLSLAAAVFESVIAAVYLDGGIEPVRKFIMDNVLEVIQESAESSHQYNFKSLLQQHAQQHLPGLPSYRLLDERGPDHSKCFEVCVELNGEKFTSAWGQSKKKAEQDAALNALKDLGVVKVDETGRIVLSESIQPVATPLTDADAQPQG